MTDGPGVDFDGFVAARWPDLEAVALVATLDPALARELTVAALGPLRHRWAATVEEGSPTGAARRALLERVGRLDRPPTRWRGPVGPGRRGGAGVARPNGGQGAGPGDTGRHPRAPDEVLRAGVDDPDDPVPGALLDALAAEGPVVRAALAAAVVWELGVPAVAALTGRRLEETGAQVDAARVRLLGAQRAALAADGRAPADHRLDDDLADVVRRVAARAADPPDPAGLVGAAGSRPRRRVVLAGGAAAAVAGATVWVATAREPRPPVRAGGTPTPSTAGPDDPVWASTSRWPPRGAAGRDSAVRALATRARPTARVLYADDVHDVRVVVVNDPDVDFGSAATTLKLWTGPAGAPAGRLTEVPLTFAGFFDAPDVVVLGVPHPTQRILLALSRPGVERAEFSALVRPRPDGTIARDWTSVPLVDGVGSVLTPAPVGIALRGRCGDWNGPVPRPQAWSPYETEPPSFVDRTRLDVASATGIAPARLRVKSLRARLPHPLPFDLGLPDGSGAAQLVTVTTPDGAVVRSFWVEVTGPDSSYSAGDGAMVVPAVEAGSPALLFLESAAVVMVPGAGRTVRLTSPEGRPSDVTPVRAHLAAVHLPDVALGSPRIHVEDSTGRTVYDGEVPASRPLEDFSSVEVGDF